MPTNEKLGRFYETGDANEMMRFFAKMVKNLYSIQTEDESL